jgi:hypothetical protein
MLTEKKSRDCWQLGEEKVTQLILKEKYRIVVEEQSRVSKVLEF